MVVSLTALLAVAARCSWAARHANFVVSFRDVVVPLRLRNELDQVVILACTCAFYPTSGRPALRVHDSTPYRQCGVTVRAAASQVAR